MPTVVCLFPVGLTASCFGMGATLSNFLGQMVVEHFGHVASLQASLLISVVPIIVFAYMPETYGARGTAKSAARAISPEKKKSGYQTFSA